MLLAAVSDDHEEVVLISPEEDIKNGTEISFMNCSDHAAYFLWMFGDGTTSFEKHPKHVYSEPGTYHILLIAQNRQFRDLNADMIFSQLDAEQADSTSADIQVVN